MSHALSDDQVSQELKKMTAFIKQEAMEKGREIELKANDTSPPTTHFPPASPLTYPNRNSPLKNPSSSARKRPPSTRNMRRNSRPPVLSARQELLDGIFEQAQGKLKEATNDKGKYTEILKNLLLEGMYALDEGKLQVRGRKQDYDLIKKAIEEAQKVYKEKMKKDVTVSIDEKNPLPEESAGGLSIVGGGGKIDINNTFEERLKLLQDNALPSVRTTLFGPNVNRKFYD
ncbi:V-type proton ATPase subunit E [Botrytis cinerea]